MLHYIKREREREREGDDDQLMVCHVIVIGLYLSPSLAVLF